MRIKTITFKKEFKKGLPHYSNITAGMELTIELEENEKLDKEMIWEEINRELDIQVETIDPAWIRGDDKGHYYQAFNKNKNENKGTENQD
jgi:hypothetical protein